MALTMQRCTTAVHSALAGTNRRTVCSFSRPTNTRSNALLVLAKRSSGKTASPANKSRGSSNKQRTVLPPNAPRTDKENKESVVTFVAIAALFLSGVLFVVPALVGGSPGTSAALQKGVNKTFGIEDAGSTNGKSYAPGPGPAAAPGSPATRM